MPRRGDALDEVVTNCALYHACCELVDDFPRRASELLTAVVPGCSPYNKLLMSIHAMLNGVNLLRRMQRAIVENVSKGGKRRADVVAAFSRPGGIKAVEGASSTASCAICRRASALSLARAGQECDTTPACQTHALLLIFLQELANLELHIKDVTGSASMCAIASANVTRCDGDGAFESERRGSKHEQLHDIHRAVALARTFWETTHDAIKQDLRTRVHTVLETFSQLP